MQNIGIRPDRFKFPHDVAAFEIVNCNSVEVQCQVENASISIGHGFVDKDLKRMSEVAMSLTLFTQEKCPRQLGITECGYYVLKFMKSVVREGLEVLKNDFKFCLRFGGRKNTQKPSSIWCVKNGLLMFQVLFTSKSSMRNLFNPRNQGLNPSRYTHNDLRPEKKIDFDVVGKRTKIMNFESRSFENSYIPENPRTPKPSLYNTYLKSCTYAQKIKKSCTYAKVKKKYRFFGNFFQRIVMIKNVLEGSEVVLGSFENSYIPENPRTPPISYISQTVIPFKKPTSEPSKTFRMNKIR
ncbi:hypothetical protein LXL04_017173 [Taraxacum kok-saghyz]